jgi:hypothetical protein
MRHLRGDAAPRVRHHHMASVRPTGIGSKDQTQIIRDCSDAVARHGVTGPVNSNCMSKCVGAAIEASLQCNTPLACTAASAQVE